jgi:hypothetical protein
MAELRDAVTRMCAYLGQKTPAGHWMGKTYDVSKLSRVSLFASLLILDAELWRDEESNQKHFQLTAFISQSTMHLHFERCVPVAAHTQKSGTCQTWEIRSQITGCQQTSQHTRSLQNNKNTFPLLVTARYLCLSSKFRFHSRSFVIQHFSNLGYKICFSKTYSKIGLSNSKT